MEQRYITTLGIGDSLWNVYNKESWTIPTLPSIYTFDKRALFFLFVVIIIPGVGEEEETRIMSPQIEEQQPQNYPG